jgi:hypothetical protein
MILTSLMDCRGASVKFEPFDVKPLSGKKCTQIAEAQCDLQMVEIERCLINLYRSFVKWLSVRITALGFIQQGKVIESLR